MAPGNSIGTTSVHPGYFQFPGATLAIVPTLTGDYHASGGVDAAEYVLWRNTLGQTGISLAADSNFDRHVNDVDYTAWRSNFGTVTPGERRGRRRSRTGYPNLVSCGDGGNAWSPTRGCLIISHVLMDYGVAVFESSQADNAMTAMAVPACVM